MGIQGEWNGCTCWGCAAAIHGYVGAEFLDAVRTPPEEVKGDRGGHSRHAGA